MMRTTMGALRQLLSEVRDKRVTVLNPSFDGRQPTYARPEHTYGLADVMNDDEEDDWDADIAGHVRKDGRTSYSLGHDPNGATFQQIADDLGFSVAGAKQAVDSALYHARFLASLPEDEREIAVLTVMNDYIKRLANTGELEPDEVKLMKDNPDIIMTLDGFREFMGLQIKRMLRAQEK